MSKSIPGKVNMPKVNVTNINDTVKKSNITKWLPFICAGTAVGVSILALKELKKIKNEMSVVKNQQKIVKSDPLLNKKMEQLEEQLKKINEYLVNNNPKNPNIMKNAVKNQIPREINIINEPEENIEYEEVEVTDDEDSDDDDEK
jgi:hypothetical protein